ncbi:MAG: TrkA3 [Candidatus Magnetoglobus multicellularis str. Araruama]|uniref:TrkA3 n=1 Tax=Candidatus Magnetoglobus multicellularis str. Araruama TaxID=890399 RepID=A0A1V1PFL1_9BACT|nr:MAG: TrkA3 [Candidatus Magnetoglobus multicellularis str. Araruama]
MDICIFSACFIIIAIASKEIGHSFIKTGLPLISGFLLTGIITGPYALNLITADAVANLKFIDELSLGFIAFAASNELHLKELKKKIKSIAWITTGLIIATFVLCSAALFFVSDWIPFMKEMPTSSRIAVSILAGSILVARSPSSAIAIINELRAKGPFTGTILSVTVIMDVLVIIIFSASSSIADAILSGLPFSIGFIGLLLCDLFLAFALGYILNKFLLFLLRLTIPGAVKQWGILISGYLVFVISKEIKHFSHIYFAMEIMLEPLLVCMVASFYVSNYSRYRQEFSQLLNNMSPLIYIAFFTLTGASLSMDVLVKTWHIAVILFCVRCAALFVGSYIGGTLAGLPSQMNRMAWMGYVTQAGVGLGLAKEVSCEFSEFGDPFATVIISVIVINQIIGPPFFKRAIKGMNEDRPRAKNIEFEGIRDAIIFGTDGQAFALARSLISHGWLVKIAGKNINTLDVPDMNVVQFSSITLTDMQRIQLEKAGAIVAMMSDEENYQICEIAYEHFGTETLIARLSNRSNFYRFQALDVLIVDPGTAIVNLLDHFVRSPSGASLLMGLNTGQNIMDITIRNPEMFGVAIRDLTLPFDTIIMSIRRRGQIIIPHGYTPLEAFDLVTVVGSLKNIEAVALQCDVNPEYAMVNFVTKAKAKQLPGQSVEKQIKQFIKTTDISHDNRFNTLISRSHVLDIRERIEVESFFQQVAHEMSGELNIPHSVLYDLLRQREQEASTVLSPGLAVPHIIIQGEKKFSILLARCKPGIVFSDSQPRVYAAFVLVGTKDERDFHLQALSAIARIVLTPNFENRWKRARSSTGLKHVMIHSNRLNGNRRRRA